MLREKQLKESHLVHEINSINNQPWFPIEKSDESHPIFAEGKRLVKLLSLYENLNGTNKYTTILPNYLRAALIQELKASSDYISAMKSTDVKPKVKSKVKTLLI